MHSEGLESDASQLPPTIGTGQLRQKTLGSVFWSGAGMLASMALKVVVLAVLARLLTPADFGTVGAALIAIDFALHFAEIGLGPALIQRSTISPKHVATAFSTTAIIGVGVALLYMWQAESIAQVFGIEGLAQVVQVLSVLFILHAVRAPGMALLQRSLRFRAIFFLETAAYVIGYAAVGITAAAYGLGCWALVAANIAETTLLLVGVVLLTHKSVKVGFYADALRELWGFGAAQTAMSVAGYLVLEGDKFIVARYLGTEALGLYGRAYQLMMIPNRVFSQAIGRVLFPAMAQVQHLRARLGEIYVAVTMIAGIAVSPLLALGLVFPEEIVLVALGPKWVGTVSAFQILIALVYIRLVSKVGYIAVRATGVVRALTTVNLLHAAMVIGFAYALVQGGIAMVAVAISVAAIVDCVLATALACHLCQVRPILLLKRMTGLLLLLGATILALQMLRGLMAPAASPAVQLLAGTALAIVVLLAGTVFRAQSLLTSEGVRIVRELLAKTGVARAISDRREHPV